MYTHIYDHIDFDSGAVYQIKIKGELTGTLRRELSKVRITSESSDKKNPVTMITIAVNNQRTLYGVLRKIHRSGLPIIAVICTEIVEAQRDVDVDVKVNSA